MRPDPDFADPRAAADAADADDTRPPSVWPSTLRPEAPTPSHFAASRFDPLAEEKARADAHAAVAFDVWAKRRAGAARKTRLGRRFGYDLAFCVAAEDCGGRSRVRA